MRNYNLTRLRSKISIGLLFLIVAFPNLAADAVECPTGTTGTHPNCVCPSGYYYHQNGNYCENRPDFIRGTILGKTVDLYFDTSVNRTNPSCYQHKINGTLAQKSRAATNYFTYKRNGSCVVENPCPWTPIEGEECWVCSTRIGVNSLVGGPRPGDTVTLEAVRWPPTYGGGDIDCGWITNWSNWRELGTLDVIPYVGISNCDGGVDCSIQEGHTARIWVQLDQEYVGGTVKVDYTTKDGTAKAGEDYTAVSGTLSIPDRRLFAGIDIDITDDNDLEGTEKFSIVISNPVNAGLGSTTEWTVKIPASDSTPIVVDPPSDPEPPPSDPEPPPSDPEPPPSDPEPPSGGGGGGSGGSGGGGGGGGSGPPDPTTPTCPSGATGTYPDCNCPDGYRYRVGVNVCQLIPNMAPVIAEELEALLLVLGTSEQIELSDYFQDPEEEPMTYEVQSSDEEIVTAEVDEGALTLHGASRGLVAISVTAIDDRELKVSQSFDVRVKAPPSVVGDPAQDEQWAGDTLAIDLSSLFEADDGGELTFEATTEDSMLLIPTVDGHMLLLHTDDSAEGEAMITVIATDVDNLSAMLVITVATRRYVSFFSDWRRTWFIEETLGEETE